METKPHAAQASVKREPGENRDLPRPTGFIVDQLADIIAHGGDRGELELLIYIALMHSNRKVLGHCGEPGGKLHQSAKERSGREFPEYRSAMQALAEGHRPPEWPEPANKQTIADRLRACVLADLQAQFRDFLVLATPEEVRLLRDMMLDWSESRQRDLDHTGQSPLAQAFAKQLDRGLDQCYVTVPEELLEEVQDFVRWRTAMDREHGTELA